MDIMDKRFLKPLWIIFLVVAIISTGLVARAWNAHGAPVSKTEMVACVFMCGVVLIEWAGFVVFFVWGRRLSDANRDRAPEA